MRSPILPWAVLPALLLVPAAAGLGTVQPYPVQFVQATGVLELAVPSCAQTLLDVPLVALFDGPDLVFAATRHHVGDVLGRVDLAASATGAFAGYEVLCAAAGLLHLQSARLDCAAGELELVFAVGAHAEWHSLQTPAQVVANQLAPPVGTLTFRATSMLPCWERVAAGLEGPAPGGTDVLGLACLRDDALYADVNDDGQVDVRQPVVTAAAGACGP